MTNLEKLDTFPVLQKALELERARADKAEDEWRDRVPDLAREREARQRAEGNVRELRTKLEDYMRADKALTVASEKWKARAEQAERERDAERLAREGAQQHRREAETRLREATERNLELIAARERAEVERNALKQEHDEDQGVIRVWRGRCERAEADNAALLDDISEAARLLREGHDPTKAGQILAGALIAGRRGAALLKRVRALEAVLPLAAHDEACRLVESEDWGKADPERCALCAADALKGAP